MKIIVTENQFLFLNNKIKSVEKSIDEQIFLKPSFGPLNFIRSAGNAASSYSKSSSPPKENPSMNFDKNTIDSYKKEYPCMPTSNVFGVQIKPEVRDRLYKVFIFIKKNKEKLKSDLGIPDDKTLSTLFKMSLLLWGRMSSFGINNDGKLKRFLASYIQDEKDPIAQAVAYGSSLWKNREAKTTKREEPSVSIQMQPSAYKNLSGTKKIFGDSISALWTDYLAPAIAIMEYIFINYNRAKKIGWVGPSIHTPDGKTINDSTFGDWNWDVAYTSYIWPFQNIAKKFCKIVNSKGQISSQYAGDCTKKETVIDNEKYKVLQNQVIKNYFPALRNGSNTTRIMIQDLNRSWSKLQCFDKI